MQSITYSDIPQYLQCSAFYQSLNEEDRTGELQIPTQCLKPDDSVTSVDDFVQLLRVTQFWGIDHVPFSMIKFCLSTSFSEWANSIPDFMKEFEMVVDLRFIFKKSAETFMSKSIERGRTEIVDHLIRCSKDDCSFDPEATMAAAKWGRLDFLQKLHENGFPWHEETCSAAAGVPGGFDCLIYAHENGAVLDKSAYRAAAIAGRLNCIMYAHSYGVEWDADFCAAAATYGQLSCLVYAHENGCPWDDKVTLGASENGHVDCLQ